MEQEIFASENSASSEEHNDIWRDQIQARVAGYRTRRGRRVEGAFSMRFPFPPSEIEQCAPAAAASDFNLNSVAECPQFHNQDIAPALSESATPALLSEQSIADSPQYLSSLAEGPADFESVASVCDVEPEAEPAPLPPPRPRTKRKVIAFPRPIIPNPNHRLADPVISDTPRILEVPEELQAFPATPLLDGLRLAREEQQFPTPAADHVDLPLQPAQISRRVCSALIDCVLVSAALAIVAAVIHKFHPELMLTKPVLLATAGVAVAFWGIYQYLFVMYCGETVGMRMMKIRLSTFTGKVPHWRQRRSRVVNLYFSTASLLMGLLWALVDVDALCWHDRISQTYLTAISN
jgi:uncharacterized RDD family membrane protein YckC